MNPRDLSFYSSCPKANDTKGNDYESILKMMRKLDAIVVSKIYADIHKREILVFGKHGTTAFIFYDEDLVDIVSSETSFAEWAATEFVLEYTTDNIVTIYR